MKRNTNSHGVITVLVSLMLVGVLSIGTLVMEAGRFQAAKLHLNEANASASSSMIASYDEDLYGKYGLFAIDEERFTLERAADYISYNSNLVAGYNSNKIPQMYKIDGLEMFGLYNLTQPSVLKRQILSRAKYHVIPQQFALNVDTMDGFFADFQNKCLVVANSLEPIVYGTAVSGSMTDISGDMRNALGALYATYATLKTHDPACDITLSIDTVELLPSTTGPVADVLPVDDTTVILSTVSDATSVLGGSGSILNYESGSTGSEVSINANGNFVGEVRTKLKDISSATDLIEDTKALAESTHHYAQTLSNALNNLQTNEEENLLLNSYITTYFSNRNERIRTYTAPAKGTTINASVNDVTFASACVEYIFGGNASEKQNQDEAYMYLCAIRFINNLYTVITESVSFNAGNIHSVAAHMAWASYESLVDMELLTRFDAAVPFNKTKMILPVNTPATVTSAFASRNTEHALRAIGYYQDSKYVIDGTESFRYRDSLAFALWFVSNEDKLLRIADLIQLEMRYNQQHIEHVTPSFLMSQQNTYCRIKCTGTFQPLLPVISVGGSGMGRVTFDSIKYAGY